LVQALSSANALPGAPPVPVICEEPRIEGPRAAGDQLVQPSASKIVVEQRPDGLTLSVPPLGFFKGTDGLGYFSLLLFAFVIVSSIALIHNFRSTPHDRSAIILGLSIFWTAVLCIFLAALDLGHQHAIIDVIGAGIADDLLLTRRSIFRCNQRHWSAGQIADIHVGTSTYSTRARGNLCRLEISLTGTHGRQGRTIALLTGRNPEELVWLAATLRRALGLDTRG